MILNGLMDGVVCLPVLASCINTCTLMCRSEIDSGTVVTYNDRQEVLCQKCTDIALHEGLEDSPHQISSSLAEGHGSGSNSRSADRQVSTY